MFVRVTFINMLMMPIARICLTSLVCANKNNGDKFYRRKSMWAVDEKLIINELGPYTGGLVRSENEARILYTVEKRLCFAV